LSPWASTTGTQTYEIIAQSFKGTSEAATAAKSIDTLRACLGMPAARPVRPRPYWWWPQLCKRSRPGDEGSWLELRLFLSLVTSQLAPPLSKLKMLLLRYQPLRKKLDDTPDARVTLSPNLVDRWPDTAKEAPDESGVDLAELPGRIYGKDMSIYERAKIRGTTSLRDARPPKHLRQTTLNMCFQLLDDNMVISKDPALRKSGKLTKLQSLHLCQRLLLLHERRRLGTTRNLLRAFGFMLGGYNDMTENVLRYFPAQKMASGKNGY
jgi:hypothetical protein